MVLNWLEKEGGGPPTASRVLRGRFSCIPAPVEAPEGGSKVTAASDHPPALTLTQSSVALCLRAAQIKIRVLVLYAGSHSDLKSSFRWSRRRVLSRFWFSPSSSLSVPHPSVSVTLPGGLWI